MLPNYQARSPFVLKHTTSIYVGMYAYVKNFARASNYVSKVKRSQFQYFSINERGESCCTALRNFVSTKKFIATLFLKQL